MTMIAITTIDNDDDNDSDDNTPAPAKKGSKQQQHKEQQQKQQQDDEDEDLGPVGAPDGSSGPKSLAIWAASAQEEEEVELDQGMIGELAPEAKREAMQAIAKGLPQQQQGKGGGGGGRGGGADSGPPGKRSRPSPNY